MNKKKMILIWTVLTISVLWIALTIYVQLQGEAKTLSFGKAESDKTALIIYDPDPFFNLDEQLCTAFAEGLAGGGNSQGSGSN